ncbi:MAG: hypothetical protein AUH30_18660 [Candidatus Rokubacteria bacterium 13_1_40CM_68_15]|nr:MAG: hypothetical protein AUH30_18660 [Candidatus Rokubacteria bacterium 13_1_40CM_68_15]
MGERGKRTRVGLTARGRTLDQGEETWRASTTPEVEDEPGQGFQIATEAALGPLVRRRAGAGGAAAPEQSDCESSAEVVSTMGTCTGRPRRAR